MVKWKLSVLCAGAGASLLMMIWWYHDKHPFFWTWAIIALLCGCIVLMLEIPGNFTKARWFKAKIAVPATLSGAAIMLVGYCAYYENHLFILVWGIITALLLTIVRMIKLPAV